MSETIYGKINVWGDGNADGNGTSDGEEPLQLGWDGHLAPSGYVGWL